MRFGVFYEHQLPRPWGKGAEHRLLHDALEQIEIADRVGFDTVWEVEHHFLEEYSHSSAPDVFLAAVSQRTKRIRLGFGIVPLPPGYQHPARVAETVATLDLVSDGRVEFGTGETSSGVELAGFGVDRATKREQWAESLDVVTRMMVEEPFAGVDGRFVSMPPRNVIPKPLQKPHPPLWVACSRRETIRLAARRGVGALCFSFVEPEEAAQWVREYDAIIASEECVPGGFAVNPRVAVVLPMMCHPDEETAIERGIDGAHFFGYALAHFYVMGDHRPGVTDIHAEFERRRNEVGLARSVIRPDEGPLGVRVLQGELGSLRGAIGTPAQIRDLCRRYEEAGIDQVVFCLQAGRNRHEHICESLELFGTEVLPGFAARADDADAAREARLGDAIPAALARREPPRAAPPDVEPVPPTASGPPVDASGGRRVPVPTPGTLGRGLSERVESVFGAFVRRSDDRLLERTVGSRPALRAVFAAMAHAYVPGSGDGFTGEVQYELRRNGSVVPWTLRIDGRRAVAREGPTSSAALTVKLSVADFVRIAGGELDPGRALLAGRLDLEGDFALAQRLGEMFGRPAAL